MIYIAAPFFNDDQITRVETIKMILLKLERGFYSPKDVNLFKEGDHFEADKVFLENLRAIKESDIVLAVTNDKDQGTHWEMGYAFALDIPVIALWITDDKKAKFNLMLSQSCIASFTSYYDLEEYLKENKVKLKKINYEGSIE